MEVLAGRIDSFLAQRDVIILRVLDSQSGSRLILQVTTNACISFHALILQYCVRHLRSKLPGQH